MKRSDLEECCPLLDFIECDEDNREFYRNKTELTVGRSGVSGEPIFGFNCGDFQKRQLSIEFPEKDDQMPTLSKQAFQVAKICTAFMQQHLKSLPCYDRNLKRGFWRFLVIRQSFKFKQLLVNIVGKLNQEGTDT